MILGDSGPIEEEMEGEEEEGMYVPNFDQMTE